MMLTDKFHCVVDAVVDAMKRIPRVSSLAESLSSRLCNFFLNHRTVLRIHHPERVGKSAEELMTGQSHPHWLKLLGFE